MSAADRPARFDSPEQEAFLNLWRTYDRLRAIEDALFGRYDLTPQQYNALRLLRSAHPEPLPTLTLASRLVSRAPDITRLVDKLVERRLATRRRADENRRVVEVALTGEGQKLLAELDVQVRQCHLEQLGHLSKDQLARLVELLQAARAPHETGDSPWSVSKADHVRRRP